MSEELKAFIATLYEKHSETLYRIIYSYINNSEDAHDLTEEIFLLAAKKAKMLYQHPNPDGWLFSAMKFKLKEYYRTQKDSALLYDDLFFDINSLPDNTNIEDKVLSDMSFNEFISELPDNTKNYILLRFKKDMKLKDISKDTNTSVGALKQIWYRFKRKIKKSNKTT